MYSIAQKETENAPGKIFAHYQTGTDVKNTCQM